MDIKIIASMFEDLKKITIEQFNDLKKIVDKKSSVEQPDMLSNYENQQVDFSALQSLITETNEFVRKAYEIFVDHNENVGNAFASISRLETEKWNKLRSEISTSTALLNKTLKTPPIPQVHQHILEIKSSKVVVALIALTFLLLISFVGNIYQYNENSRLYNNDIKFRFVKMSDGIDAEYLHILEDVFEYNPDIKAQNEIRQNIEEFERIIKRKLEDAERVKRKENQAKELLDEVNEIKNSL